MIKNIPSEMLRDINLQYSSVETRDLKMKMAKVFKVGGYGTLGVTHKAVPWQTLQGNWGENVVEC